MGLRFAGCHLPCFRRRGPRLGGCLDPGRWRGSWGTQRVPTSVGLLKVQGGCCEWTGERKWTDPAGAAADFPSLTTDEPRISRRTAELLCEAHPVRRLRRLRRTTADCRAPNRSTWVGVFGVFCGWVG